MNGKKVAILVENLYEDLEFWYPYYRLREEGFELTVVGTGSSDVYKSKHDLEARQDITADKADPNYFDAVVIPGGYCPDYLRRYSSVIEFVRKMNERGKIIAAICHAGWVLASADIVRGRKLTCFKSIKDDMINAGATYLDKEVVRDGNIITSRFPADLPFFCSEIIRALKEQEIKVTG